jgi:IS1 family transposase
MPTTPTKSSWAFPPNTQKIQLDEKWSFVYKKEKNCTDTEQDYCFRGDQWDHVALDPDHRLVVSVLVGKRLEENAEYLLEDVKKRLGGRAPEVITSDEYAPYKSAIEKVFGEEKTPERTGKPGRPAGPRIEVPTSLHYATVHKTREKGRVKKVETKVVMGALVSLVAILAGAKVSTSYIERQHATDRHRNARKARKTYRFSKDWDTHVSVSYFTLYSYNFCWPVRTLREKIGHRQYRQKTPAMSAGLADHVWSLNEWLSFPAVRRL